MNIANQHKLMEYLKILRSPEDQHMVTDAYAKSEYRLKKKSITDTPWSDLFTDQLYACS